MCDRLNNPTCFECRNAEIDGPNPTGLVHHGRAVGDPGCHTLPNGDPGYPLTPAEAICLDEKMDIMRDEVEQAFREIGYKLESVLGEHLIPNDIISRILLDHPDYYYEDFAKYCPRFDPILIEKCDNCGAPINKPRHNWPYVVTFYDDQYACGEECKKEMEKKLDEEIDQPQK